MTKPDLDDIAAEAEAGPLLLRRALLALGGGIVLLFIAGMIAGYASVVIEQGDAGPRDIAILGAMLLAGALVGYGMWRRWPRGLDEPLSPRVRSARRAIYAAIALGLPLGLILGVSDEGSDVLLSSAPISPELAAAAIGLWLIGGPLLTWIWWRNIDEHEAGAYREGALVAAHAYIFVTPVWWMASRAGWLPPLDPMLTMLALVFLWCAVWFARRYL